MRTYCSHLFYIFNSNANRPLKIKNFKGLRSYTAFIIDNAYWISSLTEVSEISVSM